MAMSNVYGIIICFAYVFAVIGVAEGLRRWRGYGSGFTRKVIHIGVGMMIWFVPFIFTSPWPFVLPCAAFMFINFVDWRYGLIGSMQSGNRSNLGTVYFPFAAAVVALLFWEQPPLMVAALMPMTWGDGLAPVVGARFGRHSYHIGGSTRTLEGSAGFFVAGFIATWLALWVVPGAPNIGPGAAVWPALIVVAAGTLVEALSVWGLDNLTVTAAAIAILKLFF